MRALEAFTPTQVKTLALSLALHELATNATQTAEWLPTIGPVVGRWKSNRTNGL
jgi:hypothetical protein